jgi:hypothetical protein
MNHPEILQSAALVSGNALAYRAPAINAGAALPPNAVVESVREFATRKYLRETVDEANGVTVGELNESKRRKMDIEALSHRGNLQTEVTDRFDEAMDPLNAVGARIGGRIDSVVNRLDNLAVLVARVARVTRIANNPEVRQLVPGSNVKFCSDSQFSRSPWFIQSGSFIINGMA